MLEQLKEIYDCNRDVEYMKEEKLNRLSFILQGYDIDTASKAAKEVMKGQTNADTRSGEQHSN